jgi:hypothetical protein
MKRLLTVLSVCLVLSAPSLAQSWSEEQLEVWNFIQGQWDATMKKDPGWVEQTLHEKFQGWAWENPAPRDKAATAAWERYSSANSTTLVQSLHPLRIVVAGDTAVAHYVYSTASENHEGKRETTHGRYTDILVRTDGKWRFLAWSGGDQPDDD